MDNEQAGMEVSGEPVTDSNEPTGGRGSGRRAKMLRLAVWVALGIAVAAVAFDFVTASPRLCVTCHEMRPRASSWQESAHAGVSCWKCHQKPRPWYAYPVRLVDRGRLLARDVRAHRSGDFADPVDGPVAGVGPMSDEVCLQCHEPNRKATSGFRIKINHVEHARRNGSCVSCHVRTAHPLEERGTPLTLMSQCFTCHGTAEQPTASSACILCHPTGYKLVPQSHAQKAWVPAKHAASGKTDPKQCSMCHQQSFCDDCHGLEMPHPKDWSRGADGHAAFAETNRAVCSKCHTEKPDLCSMCHHKAYDPAVGSWVKQHFIEAQTDGVQDCMRCHAPSYCVSCHVSWASSGVITP